MSPWRIIAVILTVAVVVVAGSAYVPLSSEVRVRVITTTSLYATGLLDYLADRFKERYPNVRLEFIAVGTGAALRYAEHGDACMILVHAPNLEKQYIERGVLEAGEIFAYNYFIVVGPNTDPAGINGSSSIIEVFKRIYSAGELGKASFVSRGDKSGTNVRELGIWGRAGLNPAGRGWYKEAAAGMDQTLVVANELSAYALTDVGTYSKLAGEGRLPRLAILYANPEDPDAINIYSAYLVRGCSGDERRYATLFLGFLREHQGLIGSYGMNEYGQPLFHPAEENIMKLKDLWSRLASNME
jgi:tungstate transport system substrate-binding protein